MMTGVTCLPSNVLSEKSFGRWHGIREVNETRHVVDVVSGVLKKLCVDEDEVAAVGEEDWLRHFTSDIKPSFGLMAYIDYLVKQTKCTTSELIVALIYLDRLTATHHPRIILSTYTIHRLFLTSLLLSCKFLDDRARGNNFFARIVNCSCEELNTLETIMLTKLGFKLFVSTNTYASYAEQVFPTL